MMPKKVKASGGEEVTTTHIRVFPDIAEMVKWIVIVEGRGKRGGAPQLVDPLLRPALTVKYKRYQPEIERLKALEEEAKRVEAEVVQAVAKKSQRKE